MPLIRYLNRSPPSLAIWTWFLSLWIWSTAITYDQKIQWNTTGFTQPVASPKFTIYIHQRLINFSHPASHIKSSNSKVYLFRHSYTYWKKDNLIFDGFHVPWKSIKFLHFKTRKKHKLIHTQYHNRMSGNFIYKSKIRLLVAGSSLIGGILNNFRISTSDILINQIDNVPVRNIVSGVRIVDQRLKYLNASGLLAGVAFDQYSFVRDAYLQRRRFLIYDGEPPLIDDYDDQNNRMQYPGEEKRMR